MIAPPDVAGVAFSGAADGDIRGDDLARVRLSDSLGISASWATVTQVHGCTVVEAQRPGELGDADAIWTAEAGLPIAVFTADCFGVVLKAEGAVGVAHAGWRGTATGVVGSLAHCMDAAGHAPLVAAIGPGIGSCCFEVGSEVVERFPARQTMTDWGTQSVDLIGEIIGQLPVKDVWCADRCTKHENQWFSHRSNRTKKRMAALAWL